MAAVDIKTNLVSVTNMSPRFSAGRIDWPFDICSLISSCFSIGTAVQSGDLSQYGSQVVTMATISPAVLSHTFHAFKFINCKVDTFYPVLSLGRSIS